MISMPYPPQRVRYSCEALLPVRCGNHLCQTHKYALSWTTGGLLLVSNRFVGEPSQGGATWIFILDMTVAWLNALQVLDTLGIPEKERENTKTSPLDGASGSGVEKRSSVEGCY